MKPTPQMIRIGSFVFGGLALCALLLAGLFLAPAAPAYAGTETPPARPTPDGAKLDARLVKVYAREQGRLQIQADNLDKANAAAEKGQTLIDALKAKGKDTTALETALATAKAQVAAAQTAHDTAASVLSAHAGFDADGKVTDREQAQQTVKSASEALLDAHLTLKQAQLDLRVAIRNWRKANPDVK